MGAYRLNAVTDAAVSGMVLNARAPILFPSHVTVGTTVDVAIMVHVWPLMLAQPYPLGNPSAIVRSTKNRWWLLT
jgi:hypothetical protein